MIKNLCRSGGYEKRPCQHAPLTQTSVFFYISLHTTVANKQQAWVISFT